MRLILFFLLSAWPWIGHCEPIPPHAGEWTFTDYADYYRTSSNYLTSGFSSSSLPLDGSYSLLSDTLAVQYDLNANWRFLASVGWADATANGSTVSYTGENFTEFSGGAQYWWKRTDWAIVPTASFGYPFYRVNVNTVSSALVSNAAAWFELGSWAIYYNHPWAFYAYGGFRYQDSGLASLLNLDLGASYRFSKARLRLGLRGETTLIPDSDTNSSYIRWDVIDQVDSGSEKFFSVNPTLFEAYSELDYLFLKDLEAGLGLAQSLYGVNSADGWSAMAMVRFRLPGANPVDAPPPASGPNPDQFQEKVEPYDKNIFEESNPDQAPSQPQNQKAKATQKSDKSLDRMFKDTEKSLEKPQPEE